MSSRNAKQSQYDSLQDSFSLCLYRDRLVFLAQVGLLPKYNEEHISFAYAKYSDTSAGNEERARGFKDAFSVAVDIAFVGVWYVPFVLAPWDAPHGPLKRNRDTVASCGLFGRHLPFTASNHIIRVFRHALALDERRSKFKPNLWHRNAHSPEAAANDPDQGTPVVPPLNNGPHRKETANDFYHSAKRGLRKIRNKETVWSDDREAYDLSAASMECDIREVWFPGCHADVGGGSVKNGTKHCLANASLVWMVNHIISADVGVIFKRRAFEGLEHKGLRPIFQSGTPLLATLDPPSRDGTASQASGGELSIVLENAEGNTSEIDVPDGEPGSSGRAPPARKPTIMPGYSNQGVSKEETPPSATSRTKKFSTLLKVFDRQSSTTSPPRPPSPSSPMGSFSPISPIIASMRNGAISAADANAVPILLAPKDPKSGRALNDNDPRALAGLTQVDEVADANSDMVDQLDKRKFWWLLEVVPLWQHYQDRHAYWHKGFHLNRGRARSVLDPGPLFHSSVKLREGYVPRAKVRDSEPTYVEF
ncbi:hypothetical protein FRC00_003314 [Tulasnella sp. 408]|nr:hypothetical protein FRC00_003314 [Tulasnella sp. 408]